MLVTNTASATSSKSLRATTHNAPAGDVTFTTISAATRPTAAGQISERYRRTGSNPNQKMFSARRQRIVPTTARGSARYATGTTTIATSMNTTSCQSKTPIGGGQG